MIWLNIFYSICWNTTLLILWFKTDWLLHYCQLLNLFGNFRQNFVDYISKNPQSFFPDYLYELSTKQQNRAFHFFGKLLSCPLCLGFWFSVIFSGLFGLSFLTVAPIYIGTLFIFFLLKKFL